MYIIIPTARKPWHIANNMIRDSAWPTSLFSHPYVRMFASLLYFPSRRYYRGLYDRPQTHGAPVFSVKTIDLPTMRTFPDVICPFCPIYHIRISASTLHHDALTTFFLPHAQYLSLSGCHCLALCLFFPLILLCDDTQANWEPPRKPWLFCFAVDDRNKVDRGQSITGRIIHPFSRYIITSEVETSLCFHSKNMQAIPANLDIYHLANKTKYPPAASKPRISGFNDDRRWSELVPSDSALAFAVIWDPEDGLIAFSAAELLDGLADQGFRNSPALPSEPCDTRSQVLTLGTVSSANMMVETPTTLAFFRDTHRFLFTGRTPPRSADLCGSPVRGVVPKTQTSSTIGGMDVYLRGSLLGVAHADCPRFSCFDLLERDFEIKSLESIAPEVFPKPGHLHRRFSQTFSIIEHIQLSSKFSISDTSTSNYVHVDINVEDDEFLSTTWSVIEPPETPTFCRLAQHDSFHRRSQTLKKRRRSPAEGVPAPPSEVLQRSGYNHEFPMTASTRASCSHRLTVSPAAILKAISESLRLWRDPRN